MSTKDSQSDNPARRLYSILLPGEAKHLGTKRCSQVWVQLLQLQDENDLVEIYRKIGLLLDQVDRTESLIRTLPSIEHDLYLGRFPSLRKGLSWNRMDVAWSGPQEVLYPSTVRDLAFCASKIAETYSEGIIERAELDEIMAAIDDLDKAIQDSSLDTDLLHILNQLVLELRRAATEYRIRGAAGLRETMAKTLGFVVMTMRQAKAPANETIIGKALVVLRTLDAVLARVLRYQPILAEVTQNLLPGCEIPQ